MKWVITPIILLCFLYRPASAQPTVTINYSAQFIEIDKLANIYAVNGSEIVKYNAQGIFLYRYSDKLNGAIASIDVTNPLRIVIFFLESNVITLLNQQLSEIANSIDVFNTIGIEASCVGTSSKNGYWIYSNDKQSLMLFDQQMTKIQESQNLSEWILNNEVSFIKEQNQKVYLGIAEKVLVFDMFGTYLTSIHFKDAKFIKLHTHTISFEKNNKLIIYNLLNKSELSIKIPQMQNINQIIGLNNTLYFVASNSIFIYQNYKSE